MATSSGPPTIITDRLVFTADAGNTRCYIPGESTGTDLIGDTTLTLNNQTTISGTNSWLFDGTDDSITSTTGPALSASASLSCWFNPSSYGNYESIISSRNYYTAAKNNNWAIQVMADYRIVTAFCNGTSIDRAFTSHADLTGTWNYLVVTTEGTTPAKTYVNNVLISTLTLNEGQTNPMDDISNGTTFGSDISQGNDFNGFIGGVLFYNKTLSTSEMLQNYNSQKARFGL